MGFLTPNDIENFRSLYTLQLRYMLSSENQIIDGLESMIKAANDQQLKDAFQSHRQETELHSQRLQELLSELKGDASDKKCAVTAALVSAAANIISESEAGPVRDAGLIAGAQKVEHFEMASYGSARDWAKQLNLPRHAEVLQKTLDEEKHANNLLNTIAARENRVAVSA